jgi:hypothetical protein
MMRVGIEFLDQIQWLKKLGLLNLNLKWLYLRKYIIGKKMDNELLKKERKQWRESSLLQTKAILTLSQELDNLRKQKEILQEKLLKAVTHNDNG